MTSYCSYARKSGGIHREHHDTEHGFPAKDDDDLFRRLMLEISQAGLSFETVLKKKKAIYAAFGSIRKVAGFGEMEISLLMQNKGIIRNKLKIAAAIHNARKIIELEKSHGSFKKWLDTNGHLSIDELVKLFKANFRFTGKEIVNEFLRSTGHLPGAHDQDCPVGSKLKSKNINR